MLIFEKLISTKYRARHIYLYSTLFTQENITEKSTVCQLGQHYRKLGQFTKYDKYECSHK